LRAHNCFPGSSFRSLASTVVFIMISTMTMVVIMVALDITATVAVVDGVPAVTSTLRKMIVQR